MARTPGPWRRPYPNSGEIRATNGLYLVAEFSVHPTQSDARLIIAAPELFTALEAMVAFHDGVGDEYPELVSARALLDRLRDA